MSALRLTEIAGGVRFAIHVQPRAKKPGVGGVHGDALKVRVGAAPVDGKANDAVVKVLAEALGVARSAVRIVSGFGSRSKVVEVGGGSANDILAVASRAP